jgi:hypothetical protein
MMCEITIIDDQHFYVRKLVGHPKAIARTIAEYHADLQAEVNEKMIDVYTILTEFNDEGIVK